MEQFAKAHQSLELKKHVNAIHCTNNLTLVQRKLFNALLFNAYPELCHKSQYQIPARSLCNLIGYNSNDYGKLKRALLALMTVAIEWNVYDYSSTQSGKWRASSALAAAKLEDGMCTYEYSSIMRELLHRPEIYGRLNMEILSKFKSSYGIALYENCIRYQGLPQTPWFPLEIFRKLMGVFDDKYTAFKDFKKRVINIAVEEVNHYAPLTIIPEIKRTNQKVVSIRFKLNSKTEHPHLSEQTSNTIEEGDLVNTLSADFELSPEAIKDIFANYDLQYVREKIKIITNSESFRSGKIRGLAGYLIDAIKKDYKANKTSQRVINEHRNQRDDLEKLKKQQQENELQRYNEHIDKVINDYLLSLQQNRQQELVEEFLQDLKQNKLFVFKWYQKHGLEHPAIKSLFHDFIKYKMEDISAKIPSFEEFQKTIGVTFAG